MNHEEECSSCRGYGHFSTWGKPSADKRDRKCLDCSGTGRVLVANCCMGCGSMDPDGCSKCPRPTPKEGDR